MTDLVIHKVILRMANLSLASVRPRALVPYPLPLLVIIAIANGIASARDGRAGVATRVLMGTHAQAPFECTSALYPRSPHGLQIPEPFQCF